MRMPLLTTISEDSLLAHLIRMGTPPSYKLLTAALMVGVPTVFFYLLPKKKHITPYYLHKRICLRGMFIGISLERRVSGSAAAEVIERVSGSAAAEVIERVAAAEVIERVSGSAAAEVIGCNDDLLTKILVLLPVKSVVRFKCVSKQWSSLISSEFFTRRHVGRVDSRQPSFIMTDVHGFPELFICHHTKKKLVRVSIPSPIKKPLCEYNIVQSWNGLLLISMKFLREDRIDYLVFNPTTKQYRLLQLDGYRAITICFMCDPSKPEYYKVLMMTSITPCIYSVYDQATQEWSHNMQGSDPFNVDLGFCISNALLVNILISSIKQGQGQTQTHLFPPELAQFPEGSAYDNYIFESMEHINLVQVTFPGKNKLKFRVGVWNKSRNIWMIRHTDTLDFKNAGVRMLGMMRKKGAAIRDAVFLFHVPGQLLIYKINQGVKVLVDYRREHFYVKNEWQFEHVHPFIHTFAAV